MDVTHLTNPVVDLCHSIGIQRFFVMGVVALLGIASGLWLNQKQVTPGLWLAIASAVVLLACAGGIGFLA